MPRSFLATDEQRRRVRALAGFGMRHAQIAEVVGVGCATTLRKHFREELTRGPADAMANVRKTLFQMATSGRHPAATMFWLKTRAGWSEKGRVPETTEGKPKRPEIVVSFVEARQRFVNGEMVVDAEPEDESLEYENVTHKEWLRRQDMRPQSPAREMDYG